MYIFCEAWNLKCGIIEKFNYLVSDRNHAITAPWLSADVVEQCHLYSFYQHSLQYWYEKAEGDAISCKKMGESPPPLTPPQTNLKVALMPTLNPTVHLLPNERTSYLWIRWCIRKKHAKFRSTEKEN